MSHAIGNAQTRNEGSIQLLTRGQGGRGERGSMERKANVKYVTKWCHFFYHHKRVETHAFCFGSPRKDSEVNERIFLNVSDS